MTRERAREIDLTWHINDVPNPKVQTEPKQRTEAPSKVPEFVIQEFGSKGPPVQLKDTQGRVVASVTRDPKSEKPTNLPGCFDSPKPKTATPKKDTLKPSETRSTSPKPASLNDGFYVFTWLNAHPTTMLSPPPLTSPPERSHSRSRSTSSANGLHDEMQTPKAGPEVQLNVDEQDIKSDLKEVDDFLVSRSTLSDRLMYQECALSSRQAILEALSKAKKKIMDVTEKKDQEKLKVLEKMATIFVAADLLFQFFLPSGFEGSTVAKFWGALDTLLFVSY
jgi:hypothetical protein